MAVKTSAAIGVSASGQGYAFNGQQLQIISSRTGTVKDPNALPTELSGGTNTGQNSRLRFPITRASGAVALAFHNWDYSNTAVPNNITVRAAIESVASPTSRRPVFFNGRRDVVIEPEGVVVSDLIGLPVAAGAGFYVRTRVTVASGEQWAMNIAADDGFSEGTETGTSTTDKTLSGTITPVYSWAYGPLAILGQPRDGARPPIVGVGDSIMAWYNDFIGPGQSQRTYDWSFGRRIAANAGNGFMNIGESGDTAQAFIANVINGADRRTQMKAFLINQAKYAIVEYGVNDIFLNSRSTAQLQADLTTLWTWLSNQGIKVLQTTLTPETTSTDSWATVGNQTVKAQEATRVAINDWIRTTPAPLTAYIETADTVESARNSGKWAAGGITADGVHPTSSTHALMALAAPAGLFT